jgi:hypothetical protein
MNDSLTSSDEPMMGRADVLLRFLQLIDKDRPQDIEQYLEELDQDTERRPIADQIVDRIIAGDVELYKTYGRARGEVGGRNPYASAEELGQNTSRTQELGAFLEQWIVLETALRRVLEGTQGSARAHVFPTPKLLRRVEWISEDSQADLDYVRWLRNQAVHGVELPNAIQLIEARHFISHVLSKLREEAPENVRQIFDTAVEEVDVLRKD